MAEIINESLISVTQLPVIEEQLYQVKQFFEEATQEALALAETEGSIAEIKKKRAELTKLFKVLEDKRKEAKKSVLAPYDAFEVVYKDCVTNIYKPCDTALAERIKGTEDALKEERRQELEEFFNECCEAAMIDFINFDMLHINITLSASMKSLKESVKKGVEKVANDLILIDTQEHKEEILVEYKNTLDVSSAVAMVINRHKQIELEQERQKKIAEMESAYVEAEEKVNEATSFAPPVEEDVEEKPEQTPSADEKLYKVSFSVTGTIEQIKMLKEFLTKGGFSYEQG